jgi:hypothetical protein
MGILDNHGDKEVLAYYGVVAKRLGSYLKGKEIASKVWMPRFFFLKRGSKDKPLFIEDFRHVTPEFMELRKLSLDEARPKLNEKQLLLWSYFVPRKYSDFFYATNGEGVGRPIERVFYREVTLLFYEALKSSEELKKLLGKVDPSVMWTGASFHVYIFLKQMSHASYERHIHYSKNAPLESVTGRIIEEIKKSTDIKVMGSHEKIKGHVIIDPSQTPSGKLCRAPFSLHMKDWKTVDGVALPVAPKDLKKKGLTSKLQEYDADRVVKELNTLAKLLPSV